LPRDRHLALTKLRAPIRRTAPDAVEPMQHGMAFDDLNGPLCALQ
jgi:hypothetical protein